MYAHIGRYTHVCVSGHVCVLAENTKIWIKNKDGIQSKGNSQNNISRMLPEPPDPTR